MTKDIDLDALQAAAEAATPGPWIACGPSFGADKPKYLNEVIVDREGDEEDGYAICNSPSGLDEESSADMDFIAAANPDTILALITRLRKAEAEVEHLWGILRTDSEQLEIRMSLGDMHSMLAIPAAAIDCAASAEELIKSEAVHMFSTLRTKKGTDDVVPTGS